MSSKDKKGPKPTSSKGGGDAAAKPPAAHEHEHEHRDEQDQGREQPRPAALAAVTVEPNTNILTLSPGETFSETVVVTIPKNAAPAKANILNVKLVPSASVAPFVTSINPPGGYGPLSSDQEHKLKFEVTFRGIPCKPEAQVVTGSLDVVVDQAVVGGKKVQITVPPCRPRRFVYSVKFVCGVQAECDCECAPVQPGAYATEINVHNYSLKEITLLKRFIPVVLAGAAVGREPRSAAPRAEDKITLPAQAATMDDCCRISELLLGAAGASALPLTIGILEITSTADVSVTAVYTTSGREGGVSIRVEQIEARQQ